MLVLQNTSLEGVKGHKVSQVVGRAEIIQRVVRQTGAQAGGFVPQARLSFHHQECLQIKQKKRVKVLSGIIRLFLVH